MKITKKQLKQIIKEELAEAQGDYIAGKFKGPEQMPGKKGYGYTGIEPSGTAVTAHGRQQGLDFQALGDAYLVSRMFHPM